MNGDKKDDASALAPANAWKFWKKDEDSKAKSLYLSETPVDKIAKELGRTVGSIKERIKTYAYKEIKDGGNRSDILKKYRLEDADYKKFESKKDNKQKKVTKQEDMSAINQKIESLTNLVNLLIKNQEEQTKKLDIILSACT